MPSTGLAEHIRSDNGAEFIEKELRAWLASESIKTRYIEPGSPGQNGYIESFQARLRHECLNPEMLSTLTEARVVIEAWRCKYNHLRPHGSLGYVSPIRFEQNLDKETSTLDLLYTLNHTINPSRLTV